MAVIHADRTTDYAEVYADDEPLGTLLGPDYWIQDEDLWLATGFDLRATWHNVDDALLDIHDAVNGGYRPEKPDRNI